MTKPSPGRIAEFIKWLRSLLPKPKPLPTPKPAPKPIPQPPPIKQITMYDTNEARTGLPTATPEAVAGYVDGKPEWRSFNALVRRYPRAHHLSIAVFAVDDAQCLDIEKGDATPSQAPTWVKRQKAKGVKRPAVYSSVSSMPSVLRALSAAHISRSEVRVWTAHYGRGKHLCDIKCGFGFTGTADATQWLNTETPGHNYDTSVCQSGFFS